MGILSGYLWGIWVEISDLYSKQLFKKGFIVEILGLF